MELARAVVARRLVQRHDETAPPLARHGPLGVVRAGVEVGGEGVEPHHGAAAKLAVVTRDPQPREEIAEDARRLDEVVHGRRDGKAVDGAGLLVAQPLVEAAAAEAVLALAHLDGVAQHLGGGGKQETENVHL